MNAENLPPRKTPPTWNGCDVVSEIAAFRLKHGRWPSAVARDPQERSLGIWLSRQRVELANGRLDEFRKAALDAVAPGWKMNAEEAWFTRAREASDFCLLAGRRPEADTEAPHERHVALWVGLQRSLARAGILRKDREKWLNIHCPLWRADTAVGSQNPPVERAMEARQLHGDACRADSSEDSRWKRCSSP